MRLKSICRKLGIESAVPEEVFVDPDGLFAIFGQIRSAIDHLARPTPLPSGVLHTLRAAKQFIANGVELGYIRMPDSDCPDPAHEVPKLIDEAIASLSNASSPADERAAPDVPEKRHATDPEQQWQQFWREICTNADGSINLEQVKRELSDFSMLLSWVPRVYMHVTGGKVSKENTWPSVVMSLHDEHVNELVEEALRSELEERAASANETGAPIGWAWISPTGHISRFSVDFDGKHDQLATGWKVRPVAFCDSAANETGAEGAAIPAGYALVPIEPTPEILTAIWQNERDSRRAWECAIATVHQPAQADARVGLTYQQVEALAAKHQFDMTSFDYVDSNSLVDLVNDALRSIGQPKPRAEVTEEQPSLTNPLTPYGMLCRALRIVTGSLLYDMAKHMRMSPAKLSAMEFGREPVTPEIVREVGTYFESLGVHNMRPALQFAIDAARAQGDSHE
ncbi:hypothetical protein WS57_25535 [Burkholderia pseudomultivorans]|nr:hypothetical protein WS57_25535 [Burkholderia pseudomultivorans]